MPTCTVLMSHWIVSLWISLWLYWLQLFPHFLYYLASLSLFFLLHNPVKRKVALFSCILSNAYSSLLSCAEQLAVLVCMCVCWACVRMYQKLSQHVGRQTDIIQLFMHSATTFVLVSDCVEPNWTWWLFDGATYQRAAVYCLFIV